MHIIGRGRYQRETYASRGNGGGASSIVPLSRQRFIDGGTSQSGRDGSVARPFLTIAEFTASRDNATAPDRRNNYVGWLTPAIDGYSETIQFPAHASTELRADSYSSLTLSAAITGNVFWANFDGLETEGPVIVSMHNVPVAGTVQITDDADSPTSQFFFGGDEAPFASTVLTGGFVSNTTVNLALVAFLNATIATTIDAGSSEESPLLFLSGCNVVNGSISANTIECYDSVLNVDGITGITARQANFIGTNFQAGSNPLLTCVIEPPIFDGPSWASFIRAGGTRSAATAVLVTGGYNGAEVRGANLPLDAGTTEVSLNGAAPSSDFTGSSSGNHYTATGQMTGNRTVKLLTGGGEVAGDTILITRASAGTSGTFTLTVTNNADTVLAVIPVDSQGFVLAQIPPGGADWVLAQCGAIAD